MRRLFVILAIALFARAEQKNVKLLTGQTDLELQRSMNLIRASLGTHCDYCHVVKEEWDWASDEKPAKKRAREMIQMVAELNRTQFGGRAVISCYTCHRGSTRVMNLVPLPQTAPPFPTPVAEKPTLPSTAAVIAKYAAAMGDVTRLAPHVLIGEATKNGKTFPIEFREGDTSPLADAFAVPLPSEIGEDSSTFRKDKVGDRDAWVVQRGNPHEVYRRFFFDTESGLLLRSVLYTPRPMIGTIPQQTDYEDYRDIGGTKFPFRIRVSLVDPWSSVTRQYTTVEPAPP
ncbi:MAG: c-type cytochrome [Thermoanaerobaculia bacterium]